MLVSPGHPPGISRQFRAMVVWLHSTPLELGRTYLVKHTTRLTKVRPVRFHHRVNVNTLEQEQATRLEMNEIGLIDFESHLPLFFDSYSSNRTTGSFILIDALTNATVGAGMIQADVSVMGIGPEAEKELVLPGATETPVAAEERYARHGHSPAVFFLEGQSPLAVRLEHLLFELGFNALHVRGSEFRGDAFADVVRVTQAAGILLLYSGDALPTQTRNRIAAECGDCFFDFASPRKRDGEEEVIQRVLAIAQSLRTVAPPKKEKRVN